MVTTARTHQLVRRPQGRPTPQDFTLVETVLREPREGEVLVRNLTLSIDPYMRLRMNDAPNYIPPFELNRPMPGHATGVVVKSAIKSVAEGSIVVHTKGWRDHAVVAEHDLRVIDPKRWPSSYHLGVLGLTGFTAWVGLFHTGDFRRGDDVFISGAAGGVGSLVGQFARIKGAGRIVGSAGTDAKVAALVEEMAYDHAFNYRDRPVTDSLREAFPEQFDLYFDNVGGDHFAAALAEIRNFGRISMCGTVGSYDDHGAATVPGNLFKIVGKRLTVRGFIVSDHQDLRAAFEDEVTNWIDDGRLVVKEQVFDDFEHMPQAFIDMLNGANMGKALVRLGDDPQLVSH